MKINNYYLAFVFILFWPFMLIWQGLDFTDMGYWLTGYQQFPFAPNRIGSCWLSYFIGHWVGRLFGDIVIVYRLAYVCVIFVTALFSWYCLVSIFKNHHLLSAALIITTVFITKSGGKWINYNNLTALFYLVGGSLLFFGLSQNRLLILFMSGFILALNMFVRLPNVLGISLIITIWLWAWRMKWSFQKTKKWTILFLAGVATGLAFILVLIEVYGNHQFFLNGLIDMFKMAVDNSSHHSGSLLLRMLFVDHVMAVAIGAGSVTVGVSIAFLINKIKIHFQVVLIILISIFLALAAFFLSGRWIIWAVPGFCYIVLGMTIVRESKRNPLLTLIVFIAGMILFLAPLGSNNGMSNAIYGMFLALPLSLILVFQGKNIFWNQTLHDNRSGKILFSTIVLTILFYSVPTTWLYTYRDSPNRFSMTHQIQHPKLHMTFTTKPRAQIVAALIDELEKYVRPGDELLAYNSIGLIHFITETKPWLDNSYPMLFEPDTLSMLIDKKVSQNDPLPTVVRANIDTRSFTWPLAASLRNKKRRHVENQKVFQSFLQINNYHSTWRNTAFEIFVPVLLQ